MSQQIINVGSAPNDGTGDALRVSQQKANANFTELYNGAGVDSVQRNTFTWTTGAQTFTLTSIPNNVVFISVQGQVLSETQYTVVGTTLTILDTLDVGDNIIIVFSYNAFNTVSTVNGMTGDVVLTKNDIGLSNVDNTSDLNKPISTATQTQLTNLENADILSGSVIGNNLVITLKGGGTITIDATSFAADVRVTSGVYNASTKALDFTLSNSTIVSVPVSALLPVTTSSSLTGDGATTPLAISFSTDADNISVLGTDGKVYTPAVNPKIEKKQNNLVIVNSVSDFPSPSSGVITLLANTTYMLTDTISTSNRFILNSGTEIKSFSKYRPVFLEYTGIGIMFTANNSSNIIKEIRVKCTAGIVFNVNNTTISHTTNINMVTFDTCLSLGTINGGNILLDDVAVINSQNGFTFGGNIFSLRTNLCFFREFTLASGICIDIPIGTTILSARFLQTEFNVNTGQIGLRVGTGVIPTFGGIIKSCKFQGTALTASRLVGVNGNSTGWNIVFGDNYGIAGLQFVDVEVISTADATLATGAGTYTEATTVRAYLLGIEEYDILATNMDAQVIALMTNPVGSNVQIGLRNLTSVTNDLTSLGTATTGTLVKLTSNWVPATPNRVYNAFYVKATGVCSRFSLKIRIKIY